MKCIHNVRKLNLLILQSKLFTMEFFSFNDSFRFFLVGIDKLFCQSSEFTSQSIQIIISSWQKGTCVVFFLNQSFFLSFVFLASCLQPSYIKDIGWVRQILTCIRIKAYSANFDPRSLICSCDEAKSFSNLDLPSVNSWIRDSSSCLCCWTCWSWESNSKHCCSKIEFEWFSMKCTAIWTR